MNDREFRILSIYYGLKQIPWHQLRDKHTVSPEFMGWADNKAGVQMVVSAINDKLEAYNLIERIPRIQALDQTSKITHNGENIYLSEVQKRELSQTILHKINVTKNHADNSQKPPVVFLSYSWDSDSHKAWVLKLAEMLGAKGIDVLLDRYELSIGRNITHFIEKAIKIADRIIIVFTPQYKVKADARKGGVGFEYSIINTNLYKDIVNNEKVIPLLRCGNPDDSIPDFLQQYIHVDFSDDRNFENCFQDLIREIHKEPKLKKVALGAKPIFEETRELKVIEIFVKESNIYVKFSDKSEKQLTFSNSDSQPVIFSTETSVLFVRDCFGSYDYPFVKKIVKVDYTNLLENMITDIKPYVDGLVGTEYITEVSNPTLSIDEQYVYFITEGYATSGNLVRVNLKNGVWEIISDAMNFELIKTGLYKNLIAVGKSEIKHNGRDIYYYLINEQNQTLKEFISEENYFEFKKIAHDR